MLAGVASVRRVTMTAYEASDLINGVIGNVLTGQALFISTISAYLVVAYTVGARLTMYQVWFINFTFILFSLVGLQGLTAQLLTIFDYEVIRLEQLGRAAHFEQTGEASVWLAVAVRVLITAGSLIFMWQVRHPKTE